MSLMCLALFVFSRSALANELTAVEIAKRADEITVSIGTADFGSVRLWTGKWILYKTESDCNQLSRH